MSQSEVARILGRIDEEYQAAQNALYGLAVGTAKHRFITARMENIANCHQQLKGLLGEQEANKVMAEGWEQAGTEKALEQKEEHQCP